MKRPIFLAPMALLAACDSGPDVEMKNASVGEVAEAMSNEGGVIGKDGFLRAGLWSTSVELTELEAPGFPESVREEMQRSLSKSADYEICLTPEDVQKPKGDFFAGAGKECRYDHFEMGGGKLVAKMRCDHQGSTQLMEMAGTYSPNHYRMAMKTSMQIPTSPMGSMVMKMNAESKYIGECPAKTKAEAERSGKG